MSDISERLRAVRKHLRLKQEDMAMLLGMRQANYSNIERGRSALSMEAAKTISIHYGVNPGYLLLGEQPMMREEEKEKKENEPLRPRLSLMRMNEIRDMATSASPALLQEMIYELLNEIAILRELNEEKNDKLVNAYHSMQRLIERMMGGDDKTLSNPLSGVSM